MWRKQQSFSNYNIPSTASGLLQAFAITSDPQYPWTNNTDAGIPEDDATKKRRSEELIREQYNNINDYMNSLSSGVNSAVLINGDMTAFGHGNEWSKIKELLRILNRPYYYGLGNHDIQNNQNDCFQDGCFRNSINELMQHLSTRQIPQNRKDIKDYKSSSMTLPDKTNGSFAYTFEFGNIHFIQLQHNPTMEHRSEISGWHIHLHSNFTWLKNQLDIARDSGKIIIVNVHVKGNINSDYANLLRQYGVSAVFSGHYHTSLGNDGFVGSSIPAFISGSASQRTYLILEQFSDRLDIYSVRNNDWRNNRQLIRSIDIPSYPEYGGRYHIVTALNDSSLIDMNQNDYNIRLWSNTGGANQLWVFQDSGRGDYRIQSLSNPSKVLAWNAIPGSSEVFATPFNVNYDEHYWILERFQNGFIFKNRKNPNLVLDVNNSHTTNGTNISVNQRHSLNTTERNQTFLLRKIY
ncbi:hypothetical protein EXW39_30370 (plasmid) [Bacillus mycoides]|uniref:metallophosphoesterase n=1 Tax=Bacillus mycoides TaxID=1405 RepID=UPI001C01C1E4|nr:metallophosphoesterase [Bacillus mycoides]QWH64335.1 hypothetical protein EXW39_30370 [Bacillus mycoides]